MILEGKKRGHSQVPGIYQVVVLDDFYFQNWRKIPILRHTVMFLKPCKDRLRPSSTGELSTGMFFHPSTVLFRDKGGSRASRYVTVSHSLKRKAAPKRPLKIGLKLTQFLAFETTTSKFQASIFQVSVSVSFRDALAWESKGISPQKCHPLRKNRP